MKNLFGKELMNKGPKEIDSKLFLDAGLNIIGKKINKGISSITASGITLTNNEVKNILKVIKSLENRENLLKAATTKITSQEQGFLSFIRPLMTAGLPLMKSVHTPLAKSVFIPLGLSTGMSVADSAFQKNIYGSGTTALIISNEEMKDVMKKVNHLKNQNY